MNALKEQLKPCPFCGGKAEYATFHDGFRKINCITCSFCKANIDRSKIQEVIMAWNNRVDNLDTRKCENCYVSPDDCNPLDCEMEKEGCIKGNG